MPHTFLFFYLIKWKKEFILKKNALGPNYPILWCNLVLCELNPIYTGIIMPKFNNIIYLDFFDKFEFRKIFITIFDLN